MPQVNDLQPRFGGAFFLNQTDRFSTPMMNALQKKHSILLQKALYLSFFLLLGGCTSLKYYPGSSNTSGMDFREFSEQGFHFSPYSYSSKFESRGMISITISPQSFVLDESSVSKKKPGTNYEQHSSIATSLPIYVEKISIQDQLKKMRDIAVELGADAIVDLKIQSEPDERDFGTVYILHLSGFAIKRLN